MPRYPAEAARAGLLAQLDVLDRTLRGLRDDELLRPSRCDGWALRDLLAHVHVGLQELLVILVTPTGRAPEVDFVSYWLRRSGADTGAAPHARFVRLLAAAYATPTGLVAHLRHTADAARRAVAAADGTWLQEGRAMSTGDVLANWTVELVVHHLDATLALPDAEPPAPPAYAVTRATLDALLGQAPPPRWSDGAYVLAAAGRVPLSADDRVELGPAAARFPLLA